MASSLFQALRVEENPDGTFGRRIVQRDLSELPPGDLLIDVKYTSLNYKDALSASGHPGVTRHYPHTPGIDAAGVVRTSKSAAFQPGQEVIVTGHDLGCNTSGGLAECISVPEAWVVPRPAGLSLKEAMICGTAGFTAALCLHELERHGLRPDQGEVLVSGATGGVGSLAIGLFAQQGYEVVAVTGKPEQADFLEALGAREVIERSAFLVDSPKKPLLKARWAGAVDTVGGELLVTTFKSVKYGGAIACCGLAASAQLNTTVYPLILRAVSLLGIDSACCPMPLRRELWHNLAGPWKIPTLDAVATEITLSETEPVIEAMLAGKARGRVVVKIA